MITSISNKTEKRIEIDLTGPHGNAFYLLGLASKLANKSNINFNEIKEEMTSGDYENLLSVFDNYFGDYVIMYR
jgi:hypothetical protein